MSTWTGADAAFFSYQEVSGPRGRKTRRNIVAGEGMLVAERDFIFEGERYTAGRTQVSPDHEVAQSRFARYLTPAYDKEAGLPVLRFLERQLRERSGERRASIFPTRRSGVSRHDYWSKGSSWRLGSPSWKR